jgi:hypothetical protein
MFSWQQKEGSVIKGEGHNEFREEGSGEWQLGFQEWPAGGMARAPGGMELAIVHCPANLN